MRIDPRAIAIVLLGCALAACAALGRYAKFDDSRPEGRLSLRERSHCEDPDDPYARWCDYPHEVRAFIDRRQRCDHFRGEPWPENMEDVSGRERRKALTDAMREHCTGSDAELIRLRARYRDDVEISRALAEYENQIEP